MKNRKGINYVLVFLIPILVMMVLYACIGVYPFGKKSLLTVDLAGQYVAFFNSLKNIFTGDISMFYSFSKTLGGNMFGLVTYYLLSPFNLIFMLFDKINITEAILVINLLKIGACGLTSYIYFNKTFKDKTMVPVVFSIVYALCAYNIVYSQNLLWLDGVILLPLIYLGLDKLIESEKPMLFYTTLTLAIIINYYIGYMLCIGSLIYFIYKLYIFNNYKLSIKNNKKDIFYFFKYVFLAVGTSMVVLLPSLFSLIAGKANFSLSEFVPKQTYPVMELISRFFIGSFKNSDLSVGCPNVFISLFMIVLVVVYFFNKKINNKERRATLYLVLVFLISFIFYPVDVVWHTFQHPAGFPFRYSFIFDFVLLIIAYKSYLSIKNVDRSLFRKLIPYTIFLSVVMDMFMYNSNIVYKIIASGALIVLYLIYLFKNKEQRITTLIACAIILEMSINGLSVVLNMKYQNRSEYTNFISTYGSIVDKIKENDNSFYRLEKDYSYSTNDALMLNYNGISHFSSTYEGSNNELLGDYLGIFNRFYITNYNGSTPVTNSLFDIKYLILQNKNDYYNLIDTKELENSNLYVYENNYNLPLGFMVNSELKDLELVKYEPFINQNNILSTMANNNTKVFKINEISNTYLYNLELRDKNDKIKIYDKVIGNMESTITYSVDIKNTGELYAYMSSKYNNKIDILVNGKSIIDISDQNDYRYNILDLGYYKRGDKLEFEVVLLESQIKFNDIMFYTLDLTKFKNQIEKLNEYETLNITDYKIDYIKGNVNVTDNKLLYTSIPYDKGWNIKVDGKEVQPVKIFDSLIGIELSAGTHEIEFKYIPRGLYVGAGVSIVSLLLFIILRKKK